MARSVTSRVPSSVANASRENGLPTGFPASHVKTLAKRRAGRDLVNLQGTGKEVVFAEWLDMIEVAYALAEQPDIGMCHVPIGDF